MMSKIQMKTPLVEMDGDEMTRILWKMIKDELLAPYIDLKTEYYDLGLEHRNETDDQVTMVLQSSAQPLRLMLRELMSISLNKCGNHPTAQYVPYSMERYSALQFR